MALYRHDSNDARTLDHLFPFYGYRSEHDGENSIQRVGATTIRPACSLVSLRA